MTELDFYLLHFLASHKYVSPAICVKLIDISLDKKPDAKPNTIYKRIRELSKSGLIDKGLAQGKTHTYYITGAGMELYEEIKKGLSVPTAPRQVPKRP